MKFFAPVIDKEDLVLLESLGNKTSIIVTIPDKGKRIVLLNRNYYIQKMLDILEDNSKFRKVNEDLFFCHSQIRRQTDPDEEYYRQNWS